jgi:hypothetical protein
MKSRLRPLFDLLVDIDIKLEFYYALGKGKSHLGFIPDAVVAGGFAGAFLSGNLQILLLAFLVRLVVVPIFIFIGWFWKASGALAAELVFQTRMNPVMRRIERGVKNGSKGSVAKDWSVHARHGKADRRGKDR